jgi:DNA-directed RNA polymerase subunit M/transcription elongation factor TFIIS
MNNDRIAEFDDDRDALDEPDGPTYLYVRRPRCPDCGEVETLLAYKTVDNGDGSKTRYAKCRSCSARVVMVLE